MLTQYVAVSETEMAKLRDAGVKDSDLKTAATLICDPKEIWRAPFCKLNVMFYIDRFGDFFSKTTKTALVVKALYNSLSKQDQQEVMLYIMDADE